MGKKCSELELYEIAEQLLLKEKKWSDFDYLDEDDQGRVMAIIRRGAQALSEQKTKYLHQQRVVSAQKNRPRKDLGGLVRVAEEKTPRLARLTRRVGFELFPIELIIGEDEVVLRKIMETLIRKLTPRDMAILFSQVEGKDFVAALLGAVGQALAQDVQFHIENLPEEFAPGEVDLIAARYSITVATYLYEEEEVSSELSEYAHNYITKLRQHLRVYCQSLPDKLGLHDKVKGLTQQEWMRLVGLTPRREIANMAIALSDSMMEKLLQFLPPAQQQDVKELITFQSRQSKNEIQIFSACIESLKHWLLIIEKVHENIDSN